MVIINVFEDREKLEKLYLEQGGIKALARHLGVSINTVRRYLRQYKIVDEEGNYLGNKPKEINGEDILKLLKTPLSIIDLANRFDCAPRKIEEQIADLQMNGYQIEQIGDKYKLDTDIVPQEGHYKHPEEGLYFRIGMISDTHLGGTEQQLTHLNDFYQTCKAQGVNTVYHCGDIIAGVDVYRGQHKELHAHTYDDQVDYAITNYPQIPGITTRIISGNHDLAIIKKGGSDPVRQIVNARPDMEYLGQYSAWVEFAPGFVAYLMHPLGGMSYALSYKLQKHVESFEGGNKPNMFFAGHWHSFNYSYIRNVHAFLVPCFEAQTEFERRLGLNPTIGGLILDIKLNKDKSIQEVQPRLRVYPKMVKHDY